MAWFLSCLERLFKGSGQESEGGDVKNLRVASAKAFKQQRGTGLQLQVIRPVARPSTSEERIASVVWMLGDQAMLRLHTDTWNPAVKELVCYALLEAKVPYKKFESSLPEVAKWSRQAVSANRTRAMKKIQAGKDPVYVETAEALSQLVKAVGDTLGGGRSES